MKEIPKIVLDAAQHLADICEGSVIYIGQYNDSEAYRFQFKDDIEIGFPQVYLLKDNKVECIFGFDALNICTTLSND